MRVLSILLLPFLCLSASDCNISLSFEDDALNSCPMGWTCEGSAKVQKEGTMGAAGLEGAHFFYMGYDSDQGDATSDAFSLPVGAKTLQWLRSGGADDGGVMLRVAGGGAEICSGQDGHNSNIMIADECAIPDGFEGVSVELYVWDHVSAGWGKTYVDDIHFLDESGNRVEISCATTTHDCADFNIDGVLNECSADFLAEKEALEAATARVTQLESDTATTDAAVEALSADFLTLQSEAAMSANLAATDATVEALSADLSTLESAAAATTASLVATDATVESLSADLSTLESEMATTTADLATTDIAVGDLSSRLDSTEESVQNDYAALENRLAEIETWKAAWQNFESARAGPGIDIGAEDQLEQAAHVSVFALSASSPLMIGAMALLAVLLAVNLCFVARSCSARAKGKYATVAAVDSADSEEMSPIRV